MLLNMTEELQNYEGEGSTIPFEAPQGLRPTTVRDVIQLALNQPAPGETEVSNEQKTEFYRLTLLAHSGPVIELNLQDAALIEKRVGLISTPLVYGRIKEIFERQSSINEKDSEDS